MSTIVTRPETITPPQAVEYLKKNVRNRTMMDTVVDRYARMMKSNQWLITHQGIAFDVNGALVDGQHRLAAIIKADIPVTMMVTRGLPAGMNNGVRIDVMDAIDCGKPRSVAHQLQLSHGVVNSNLTAATCRGIGMICTGYATEMAAMSTPQALAVLDIYGEHIAHTVTKVQHFKPSRKGPIVAALSFVRLTHKEMVDDVLSKLGSGDGLSLNDPTFTLREWIIRNIGKSTGGFNHGSATSQGCLNALSAKAHGDSLRTIKPGEIGWKYFTSKQRDNVSKVKAAFGITV